MGHDFFEKWADEAALRAEFTATLPVVEIAGDHRVLIENHHGITVYSDNRIEVKVKFGSICICGLHLKLVRMSKEQLVICGTIEKISLHRRERS